MLAKIVKAWSMTGVSVAQSDASGQIVKRPPDLASI